MKWLQTVLTLLAPLKSDLYSYLRVLTDIMQCAATLLARRRVNENSNASDIKIFSVVWTQINRSIIFLFVTSSHITLASNWPEAIHSETAKTMQLTVHGSISGGIIDITREVPTYLVLSYCKRIITMSSVSYCSHAISSFPMFPIVSIKTWSRWPTG